MRLLLVTIALWISAHAELHSQITGGRGNGQSAPAEVQATPVTAGGFSGNVSLFTGIYNSSYTLGTVAEPSGLSFTATMSYSSTFSSGDNLPYISGVPYGEGWNVDIPTISVTTEDYSKYTKSQLDYINRTNPPPATQPYTANFNSAERTREGDIYWFAPNLNIPGIASGRMVYKYMDGDDRVFVLHEFERYVEARMIDGGYTWEVILDDGTRYEFESAMINVSNAPNQRVPELNLSEFDGKNMVLPKTSFVKWVCTKMYHRNKTGSIRFSYEGYGCFDYYKELNQGDINGNMDYYWNTADQTKRWKPCKELILKEISSATEKLVFGYKTVFFSGGNATGMLQLTDPTVSRTDSLYNFKSVSSWSSSFSGWSRYKHIKAYNVSAPFSSATNPYQGKLNNGIDQMTYLHRTQITTGSEFDHGYLESPGISVVNLPTGDLYEVKAQIQKSGGVGGNVDHCLFDISIATGANSSISLGYSINGQWPATGLVNADLYTKFRGTSVFSTFNQGFKWYYNTGSILQTSNYFSLPNLAPVFKDIHIQIGPASSDNDYSMPPSQIGGISPANPPKPELSYFNDGVWHSNWDTNNGNNIMQSGDPVPGNFGVGMSWYMLQKITGPYSDYYSNYPVDFWWNDNSVPTMNYLSQPTRTKGTGSNPPTLNLIQADLVRHSKNTYMLTTVSKYVNNAGYTAAQFFDQGQWHLSAQLKMEYELDQLPVFANAKPVNSLTLKSYSTSRNRKIIKLARIRQMNIKTNTGNVPESEFPTTHFTYKTVNAGPLGTMTNCTTVNGVLECDGTMYNSNNIVLWKVNNPMGQEIEIDYYNMGNQGLYASFNPAATATDRSYSLMTYHQTQTLYNPVPQNGNVPSEMSTMRTLPESYAFQNYLVVKSIKVKDQNASPQTTDYTYGNLYLFNDDPALSANIHKERESNLRFQAGFDSCVVLGPDRGGKRIKTVYYHKTKEEGAVNTQGNIYYDNLMWGKLYRTNVYDGDGKLSQQTRSTFEAVLAYESIRHRGFGWLDNVIAYDYMEYHPDFAKPVLTDFKSHSAWSTYVTAMHCYFGLPTGNHSNPETGSCDDGYGFFYAPEAQLTFSDPVAGQGVNEMSYFLEASLYMVGDDRFYLNSYFIKKTSDSSYVYDTELTGTSFTPGTTQKSILTITRYQYFDADYRGRSNSPGYGKIGMSTESDGYYWLKWEPSWQLYSKKVSSPQLQDAFSEEEYFYFYDLVNVASYQTDPVNGSYYPKIVANTKYKMLYDIWSWKLLRNLSYETRVSTRAPGETESTITKATFAIYENDWETHREPSTYEHVENPNMPPGCDGQPGGDPTVPGGGVGTGPVLPPCVIVASGNTVPAGYCYLPSSTTPNRYCLCGNTPPVADSPDPATPPFGFTGGGSPNGKKGRNGGAQLRPPGLPGSPYDDPEYFYVVSIAGMILQKYETVWVKDGNAPVMTFDPVNFNPKFNAVTDTLNVSNVLSRNLYGQVVRIADVRNTITYYNYGTIHNIEFENCYNGFQSLDVIPLNSHPGYPDAVTVGEGRPDALTTAYTYNPDLTIASITDPTAKVMTYSYDMFGRMNQSSRNGNLLQAVTYSQWKNNLTKTFQQRLDENFVKTENYLNATAKWTEWAYLDPLGREAGSKKEISTGQSYILKNAYYDAWNRPAQTRKTFLSTGTPTVTVPVGVTSADLQSLQYDNEPEARQTIAAKFGQTIGSANTVQTSYGIISNTTLTSFLTTLGLNNNVLGTWFFFIKNRDEDGKYIIELKNALGQKVAVIGNNGTTATTFIYNSHGEVKTVRNPLGQLSQYTYNYLGRLQQMTTPDEGATSFVYDEAGLLLARRDARDITRLFKYDNYGRMTDQVRKTAMTTAQTNALFANSGEFWTTDRAMAAYTPLWSNFYYYEKRWFYNTVQTSLVTTYATTNTQNYVLNNTTYSLGKPTMLFTYGSAGSLVEIRYLSYNIDGFLKWEINQFNFNGLSTSAKGMALAIAYPDYNRQGSVLTQNIDLDCDGVLDFQYYNEYDNWNRQLRTYANYSDTKTAGTKIVELLYDNIVGAVDKKTYFDHAAGCSNVQVDQVDYDYDARFRLTRIGSYLFDYDLKYDGNAFAGFTTNVTYNYNGNINAVKPSYKFNLATVNPANFFGTANVNYWNYTYDNLNRLTKADANISGVANWGDSEYTYDKAGNITNLKRYSYDYPPGTLAQDIFAYTYTTGTNKLSSVTRNGVADRTITYDANGNMYTDTKRKIANVSYGRMNLPFNQAITVAANTVKDVAMLYDMIDGRIFKRSVTTIGNTYPPNATVNGSEYYIHTLAGQEIGVYDFLNDKLTWYVFAGDRVAKIEHTPATTFGDGVDPGTGGGGVGGGSSATGGSGSSSKIFPSAKYSDMASIETNAAETGKLLLSSLRKVQRPDGQLQLPATLVLVEYPDHKQAWVLKNELTKVKGGYSEKSSVVLDDARSQLEVPMADGSSQAVVLGEALGLFRIRQKPFVQGYDPTVPLLLLAPPPPPVPQPVFYIYDHLGNTRVTFHVDITCPSTKSYVLDYAAEYYPYGKTMRDYTSGVKEKYETTQHERDQETGLDYRGARFYDGDIARFLSVDPLAKDYVSLAPYVYVAGNPVAFIDPDGKRIVLPGYNQSATETDKRVGQMAFALMQRLTNDKLSVTPGGEVYVERAGAANRGRRLEYGTKLLNDLMDDNNTLKFSSAGAGGFATFAIKDGKRVDPEFGVEYDSEINIPLSARSTNTVNADGSRGGLPVHVSFGHELIHALHNFLGQNESNTLLPELVDPDTGTAGQVTKEELKTRNDENEIRCEQNEVNRAIPSGGQ